MMHVVSGETNIFAGQGVTVCGLSLPEEPDLIPSYREDREDYSILAVMIPTDDPDEWMGHAACEVCLDHVRTMEVPT